MCWHPSKATAANDNDSNVWSLLHWFTKEPVFILKKGLSGVVEPFIKWEAQIIPSREPTYELVCAQTLKRILMMSKTFSLSWFSSQNVGLSLSWQQRCQGFIFIFGFHIHNLNQSIKVITIVINQSGNQVNQSLALAFGYEECPWIALYSIRELCRMRHTRPHLHHRRRCIHRRRGVEDSHDDGWRPINQCILHSIGLYLS